MDVLILNFKVSRYYSLECNDNVFACGCDCIPGICPNSRHWASISWNRVASSHPFFCATWSVWSFLLSWRTLSNCSQDNGSALCENKTNNNNIALSCTALQASRSERSLRHTCSLNLCTGPIRIPDSYWISSRNASNRHWSALSTRYHHYRRQRWTKPLVIPLLRYWGPKRSRKLRLPEIQIWWSSAPTDSKIVLIFRYLRKKIKIKFIYFWHNVMCTSIIYIIYC